MSKNHNTKNMNQDTPEDGVPVCEECGNAMISENDEWVCPHCQGEIDFLGDDEDDDEE